MKRVKAMIFAAGIGSRLRPLTDTLPKALVDVGGEPMLARTIRRITQAGIRDIVVNVHHHSGKIIDWLAANRTEDVDITVSDESAMLLDTGGGLLKALPLLQDADAILLHNADIFTDIPLRPLLERHLGTDVAATLAVMQRDSSRRLLFDSTDRMLGWQNIVTGEVRPDGLATAGLQPLAFCGIHVVSPELLGSLPGYAATHGAKFSMTPFYIDSCASQRIQAFRADGHTWIDIGRPETLAQARQSALTLSQ